MTIAEFISSLRPRKITQTTIAKEFEVSRQNISNKMNRDSFTVCELDAIGKMVGMRLAFIPEDEITVGTIVIDPSKPFVKRKENSKEEEE